MRINLIDSVTRVHDDASGQGLVEYVLIIGFVGLAATAGMNSIASAINSTFTAFGSKVGQFIS